MRPDPSPSSWLGLGLGAVVGLPVGMALAAFELDVPALLAADPPTCPSAADLDARVLELEAILVAAGAQAEVDESRRLAEEGRPVPWTDEIGAPFRAEAAEAAVRQVVERLGSGSVHGVDCAEYPCIATVMTGPSDGWRIRFLAKLGELGYDAAAPSRTAVLKAGPDAISVALLPPGANRIVAKRAKYRVSELNQQAVADQFVVTEGL